MTFAVDFRNSPWASSDIPGMNRLNWRSEIMFTRNKERIVGKRILDLACANGRLSFPCLALGAASVVGVEGRQSRIDVGQKRFAQLPYGNKMTFVLDDVFNFLDQVKPGTFDVILCLGFLYHTTRQVDFFRACQRLKPETVFVDTSVAKNYWWFGKNMFGKPPALFLGREDATRESDTIDPDSIMYWPTTSYIETMFDYIGYGWRRLAFKGAGITDWTALPDYKKGIRAAYIAMPKS